jgi:ABC-type bacteriocin/lantibiotic exporter with double-glycine peptidase domain
MNQIFDIINFIKEYYYNFIFKIDDNIEEKFNKSTMFLIYLLIIFYVLKSQLTTIPISLIILIFIVRSLYNKEAFKQENKCRKPDINNPFMNPLYEVDGLEACEVSEKEVLDKYNHQLNRNIKDVFNKNTGQIYFKTNNITSIPNRYDKFLNFIGMTYDEEDNNCKYDGVNCQVYNDLKIF